MQAGINNAGRITQCMYKRYKRRTQGNDAPHVEIGVGQNFTGFWRRLDRYQTFVSDMKRSGQG
jgi:hypothetical protein